MKKETLVPGIPRKIVAHSRAPRRLGVVAGFVLMASSTVGDTMRSSASYGVQFDCMTAGSGNMVSASYRQPQTVLGADVIWAPYSSGNYGFQPIGVIMIPTAGSRVSTWQLY